MNQYVHKFPHQPMSRKKKTKIESIDTTQLPVFEVEAVDKTLPYYELICPFGIFRAQTLTIACKYWGEQRQLSSDPTYKKFEILTISSIVIVNGKEMSFSIN